MVGAGDIVADRFGRVTADEDRTGMPDALRKRQADGFRRETFALPRLEAREKAREMFRRFPKPAYMTEIESWRELPDGRIEFTMRRLPTAD